MMKKVNYGFLAMFLPLIAQGADRLVVALDWLPNPNHSGLYVAMDKGYYSENDIKVEIAPYGEIRPEQLVAIKRADVAFMGAEGLMIANNSDVDVTAIAAALSENAQYVAANADSGIERPRDFVGKAYASWTNGWDTALINQMIKVDGGEGIVKSPDLGLYGPTALFAHKVDLAWLFDNVETPVADKQGIKLNKFHFKDYGLASYGSPILVVRTADLAEDPDIYGRFIRATEKGYLWAAEHPKEAALIITELNPPGTFEDQALLLEQQKISSDYYVGPMGWGKMNDAEMQKLADFMVNNQIVDNRDSLKYTNQFFSNGQ
ncbi:MAG: ABC transporter substrate-binding protein [Alphaproteobacteria bacterium]